MQAFALCVTPGGVIAAQFRFVGGGPSPHENTTPQKLVGLPSSTPITKNHSYQAEVDGRKL